jgi:hypothetical protein
MTWENENQDQEREDTPLLTVSSASLLKLHRVARPLPSEEQAKSMRGLPDTAPKRYFSK